MGRVKMASSMCVQQGRERKGVGVGVRSERRGIQGCTGQLVVLCRVMVCVMRMTVGRFGSGLQ